MAELFVCDGSDALPDRIDTFVNLVRAGGAVDEHYVRRGIGRKGVKLIFAKIEDRIVGVAALKVPLDEYRQDLETKSGSLLPKEGFPLELGYVAVRPGDEEKGVGSQLACEIVRLSSGSGLFATTSHPAMKDTILPRLGFSTVGSSWKSRDEAGHEYDLHLMIREPPPERE